MGPLGDIMPDKDPNASNEVIKFEIDTSEGLAITSGDPVIIDSHPKTEAVAEQKEPPKDDELKPTMYHGVEFPAYFQGPHFVEIKGSLVMAIDPKCVTMGMKTNWERYRHELAALGKKVVEKNLNIKIETV